MSASRQGTELEVSVQDCMPLSKNYVKKPADTAWLQKSGRACMIVNFSMRGDLV